MRIKRIISLLLSAPIVWAMPTNNPATERAEHRWVSAWTASARIVDNADLPPSPYGGNNASVQLQDASFRQTFRLTLGAARLRVQLSNLFSYTDLPVTAITISLTEGNAAGIGQIVQGSAKQLTFNGSASVVVPSQGALYSDPLDFDVEALSNVALTVYSKDGQMGNTLTGHPGSRTTSWIENGNKVNEYSVSGASYIGWLFAGAIEVWAPSDYTTIVTLGDSITDGRGSETNKNTRWPDFLANRLRSNGVTSVAVNNQGSGGNEVLEGGLGPPLIERYQRDAIEQQGVKYVLIAEGVNDIGTTETDEQIQQDLVESLIQAYSQIIKDYKTARLVTIGATITLFAGHTYWHSTRENSRLQVNNWIMTNGSFDHVVDFAGVIGDGDHLKPEFDSGDYLHPNVAAYEELANSIPLEIFRN